MKHSTPLPRTRSAFALLFFLFISASSSFAQSTSDRTAIKEWLVANKDKMTLVTMKEYQTMSPAVKAVLDADSKTLVYNTEVTMDNIYAFESKNVGQNLVAFKSEKELTANKESVSKSSQENDAQAKLDLYNNNRTTYEEQYENRPPLTEVQKWLKTTKVRVYSKSEYNAFPQSTKDKIDALPKASKLIYDGNQLTWNDIVAHEQAQITKE